ncbi:SLAM family member 5-like isoform X1 [Megalops cyprinoides]|uniref:SLAM family member 5-like isoform X1 n=1 Tax=Megalops cyprinoides TaxID=118141 RepID=UPI001863B9DA|nr:SLAM family member 5-like isoform X1 [Megalops cyprinoides]
MRRAAVFLGVLWGFGVYMPSAQAESKKLNGIVGETVSFPAAVKQQGFFTTNGTQIAKVMSSKMHKLSMILHGRLQWDSSTGLFSITGLKMEDSGEYIVQSDGEKVETIYQLTVYNPVSTPQVSSRNKMKPTCSVLCSVENGREVTLSWQREGKTVNQTSSPDLNTNLSLPLEIEEYSSTYSCVAANPVSEKRSFCSISELCRVECTDQSVQNTGLFAGIGAGFVSLIVLIIGTVVYLKSRKKPAGDEGDELTYANIKHGAKKAHPEKAQKSQAGNPEELVYSNITHNRPKKQRAEAPSAAQGEENCVYAQVRR